MELKFRILYIPNHPHKRNRLYKPKKALIARAYGRKYNGWRGIMSQRNSLHLDTLQYYQLALLLEDIRLSC